MFAERERQVADCDGLERPHLKDCHSAGFAQRSIPRMSLKLCAYVLALLLLGFSYVTPVIADTVYWNPWITNVATNTATVNWRGSDTALGEIEYATSSYYEEHNKTFNNKIPITTTGVHQHVQITDLEPNTSYTYKVKPSDNTEVFKPRKFRTFPVSGPFTFIVISDSHAQEKRFKYVADAIDKYEKDVLFILDGGDYASYDYEQYWTIFFQYADKMLGKFPLFHTIGNHEYHNEADHSGPPTAADQYHWAFDVPSGGALNYSFDCSDVRFVVLNSPDPTKAHGDDPQTSLTLARSQAPWLEAQLDNTMAGTFTIHHHPIWDHGKTGINPDLRPWETLYQKYGISGNFSGHVHNYQRFSVKGIPYFIIGNAGGVFSSLKADDPKPVWYQYGETKQLGYLKVTVDPTNNTATAQEIFVASVITGGAETATVYDPPIIADSVTFPLSKSLSTLTVNKSGLGSGTVASLPPHIDCGLTCQANFKATERVAFTPAPDKGSVFAGWNGACRGSRKCSVVISPGNDTLVGAVFEKGSCRYSISPSAKTIGYKGGQITLRATAKDYSYCRAPEIKNNTDWLAFTASPFVDNKGTVTVTIPPNDNPTGRSGTLTIEKETFTVNQKRKP